ncbi:unnamed protein product [Acanthoscelides obtectus]|nr:unnamed protein product [Acanthoscelides obtectus]CAK1657375.1 hypothetical protein AOBTE_LOCUS20316 [Acanthoscelides obtectus]
MMLEPVSRSSRWRFDPTASKNYEDNQLFCGGFYVQHYLNGGRCGICGDSFDAPHPQDNENTGLYGDGTIVAEYKNGSVIDVHIQITANHRGHFTYSLCEMPDPNLPEPGEECFVPLLLENSSLQYEVSSTEFQIFNRIRLPNIFCPRCVLRWTYTAGNNWGDCGNGTSAVGCGPQETFVNCADISIL